MEIDVVSFTASYMFNLVPKINKFLKENNITNIISIDFSYPGFKVMAILVYKK